MDNIYWKVIKAVKFLGHNAHGVTIRQYLINHEHMDCSYDTLYLALDYLEKSGVVYSVEKDGDKIQSFQPRWFYQLTASGKQLSDW